MNNEMLSKALRLIADDLRQNESEHGERLYADEAELICVLARVIEGKPLDRAFAAPGDWGYSHPVGKALAALPNDQLKPPRGSAVGLEAPVGHEE